MERTWTGHRRHRDRPRISAEKMPLRLSGRTRDPSPFGGSSKPCLGSGDAPAENSARRSRAIRSHSPSSSTSPSPQLSPGVMEESPGRKKGAGVPRRRRCATERPPLSRNDMAGKTARPGELQGLPLPRPELEAASQWPGHSTAPTTRPPSGGEREGARRSGGGEGCHEERPGATTLEHEPRGGGREG